MIRKKMQIMILKYSKGGKSVYWFKNISFFYFDILFILDFFTLLHTVFYGKQKQKIHVKYWKYQLFCQTISATRRI